MESTTAIIMIMILVFLLATIEKNRGFFPKKLVPLLDSRNRR